MVIYGTGGKDLGTKQLDFEKCPSCGEKGKLQLQGISRYFTLFWIPVFPYSKKIFTFCNACEKEIPKEQYSRELQTTIATEKSHFKFPLTHFAGIFIIGLFIIWGIYQSNKHDEFVMNRIENLQKDDILILKKSSSEYYFLEVVGNEDNEIYYLYSNYFLDQKPNNSDYEDGLKNQSDFMDTVVYYFTQNEIDSIYKQGDIDILDL